MNRDERDIALLRKWLAKNKGGVLKLTVAFGYTSTVTVNQWLYRGKLPEDRRQEILKFLKEHNS